jgi:hypothetical protein
MSDRTLYEGIDARRPPKHIEDVLLSIGGRNPYGEPMYRLVWTLGRKVHSGGEWTDYAPGTDIEDRNPDKTRPIRTVVEVRTISLYPDCPGKWMLEHWVPPEGWGDPDTWYLPDTMGGTMRVAQGKMVPGIGDFPSRGDYISLGVQFTQTNLSEAKIIQLVNLFEQQKLEIPKDDTRRRLLAVREAEAAEEAETERRIQRNLEIVAAQDDPLAMQTLAARAATCRLLEKMGIRQHPW